LIILDYYEKGYNRTSITFSLLDSAATCNDPPCTVLTSVGNAVVDELLSSGFLGNVEVRGKYLKNKLEDLASKFLLK
jgi:acetylornithine/succinyldiaminopimelate/putrescine aminotransferase